MEDQGVKSFPPGKLRIVNVGLEDFARDLKLNGAEVVHVDWAPPGGGDPKLADLLSKLGS